MKINMKGCYYSSYLVNPNHFEKHTNVLFWVGLWPLKCISNNSSQPINGILIIQNYINVCFLNRLGCCCCLITATSTYQLEHSDLRKNYTTHKTNTRMIFLPSGSSSIKSKKWIRNIDVSSITCNNDTRDD